MAENYPSLNPDHPAQYRIYAQGDFNPYWLDWLSGEWIIVNAPPAEPGATISIARLVSWHVKIRRPPFANSKPSSHLLMVSVWRSPDTVAAVR